MTHNELSNVTNGNITLPEEIPVLIAGSECAEPSKIASRIFLRRLNTNHSSDASDSTSMPLDLMCQDPDEWLKNLNFTSNSEIYVRNVVAYIGGFLVRSILPRLKCVSCKDALQPPRNKGSDSSSDHNLDLIQLKNRGGLVLTCQDVCRVCLCAEKLYRSHISSDGRFFNVFTQANFVAYTFVTEEIFVNMEPHGGEVGISNSSYASASF